MATTTLSDSMSAAIDTAVRTVRVSEMFLDAPAGLAVLESSLGEELGNLQGYDLIGALQSAANCAGARAALQLPPINDPFLDEAEREAERLSRLRRLQGIVFGVLVVSLAQ